MQSQQLWLSILLGVSVAFLVIPALAVFLRWCYRKAKNVPYRRSAISRALVFSACLLGATWCLRFAVSFFMPLEGELGLNGWEKLMNSLLHALQTFSMDEDYTLYIAEGKKLVEQLPLKNMALWSTLYGAYASVLNVAAPIAGGAFIFDILAGVFPKVKLAWLRRIPWREKLFFSELNPASAALATSLFDYYTCTPKKCKPVLIFTDTYVDGDDEKINELLLEVRRVGAVCVRDDLAHVTKATFGRRKYYLIDADEQENLKTFVNLADGKNVRSLKKSEIYLFVESDAYVRLEKQVRRKLEGAKTFRKPRAKKHLPKISPVRVHRNLIQNLLVEVPLYEPIVHRTGHRQLTLTVFGNGSIGTEAFLAAYWMGQMLDCTLRIQVISQDEEQVFWDKIDYINPEIRRTVQEAQKPEKNRDPLLRYNDTETNAPYCHVRYVQADVKIGTFWSEKTEAARENDMWQLLDTDYFIVALGSDGDNIAVSEKLRCLLGKQLLESGKDTCKVIAYAVFDSALCDTLNEEKHRYTRQNKKTDIYMHAFGSLKQVYSCENLLMTRHALWAKETGLAYTNTQNAMRHAQDNQERGQDENADYNYWANMARTMHIKYKVFSLGWIQTSLFDYPDEAAAKQHRDQVQASCALYKRIAVTGGGQVAEKSVQQLEEKAHALAWLEHRRWNAYTRTVGYRHTDALEANWSRHGSHKNMPLKLHPCLVECAEPGKPEHRAYLQLLAPQKAPVPPAQERCLDLLDRVSVRRQRLEPGDKTDFKRYDYYAYEYESYVTVEEAAAQWGMKAQRVLRLCRKEKIRDALRFDHPEEWRIPKQTVKKVLLPWRYALWVQHVLKRRKTHVSAKANGYKHR